MLPSLYRAGGVGQWLKRCTLDRNVEGSILACRKGGVGQWLRRCILDQKVAGSNLAYRTCGVGQWLRRCTLDRKVAGSNIGTTRSLLCLPKLNPYPHHPPASYSRGPVGV